MFIVCVLLLPPFSYSWLPLSLSLDCVVCNSFVNDFVFSNTGLMDEVNVMMKTNSMITSSFGNNILNHYEYLPRLVSFPRSDRNTMLRTPLTRALHSTRVITESASIVSSTGRKAAVSTSVAADDVLRNSSARCHPNNGGVMSSSSILMLTAALGAGAAGM